MSVLFAAGTLMHYVFGILMFLVAVFLILLVLVQRGRGGGLTGALGGMGGQSAFGAKAGDVFTRVTMVTAAIWILLSMGSIWVLNSQDEWGADTSSAGFSGTAPSTLPDADSDATPTDEESDLPTVVQPTGDAAGSAEGDGDGSGDGAAEGDTGAAPPTDDGGSVPSDEPDADS